MEFEPQGSNERTWTWAKRYGLRYREHVHCVHWLATGRCGVSICEENWAKYDWMDHASGWLGPHGERVLLCQPYQFDDIDALHAVCQKFGLRAHVHGLGWYGQGTVAIELTPKDQALLSEVAPTPSIPA